MSEVKTYGYEGIIHPQYDANGFDSGLWIVYDSSLGYEEPVYESVALGVSENGKLVVGQYPYWDHESYTEDGDVDDVFVYLGEFECPNPLQDEEAASRLLWWLENNRKSVEIV